MLNYLGEGEMLPRPATKKRRTPIDHGEGFSEYGWNISEYIGYKIGVKPRIQINGAGLLTLC